MKDLPKVFANRIDNTLNNIQEIYYGKDREIPKKYQDTLNLSRKINSIFASSNHVYKSKVRIEYRDRFEEKVIVGRTNKQLITIEGELINISDIMNIEKI